MRRAGILVRLLAVSLVVAMASIAATAYLTTRSTTEQLERTRARALEVDNDISHRLVEHGITTADWGEVATLVDELASATGRDIQVAALDGELLADSTGQAARTALAPSDAAATLDPLAELATPAPTERPLGSLHAGPHPAVIRFAQVRGETATPAVGAVAECVGSDGIVVLDESIAAREFAGMRGDHLADAPLRLLPPADVNIGEATACRAVDRQFLDVQAAIVDGVVACLEDRGQSRTRGIDVRSGLALLLPLDGDDPLAPPSSAPLPANTGDESTSTEDATVCELEAVQAALEPHVAPPAFLHLSSPPTSEPSLVDRLGSRRALPALALVLLVTFAASAWAARRVLRPVRALTDTTQQISGGDRTARVDVHGSDEVARLGAAFNTMVDAVESGERQRNALISDVAHELRNPLAVVRGHLEGARDRVVDADDEFVESLLEETLLLQRLVDDLQDLALAEAGRLVLAREPVDVVGLVAQVVDGASSRSDRMGVEMTMTGVESALVFADPIRLRQVVSNLVENAITHTGRDGAVTVAVGIGERPVSGEDADPTGTVYISIADSGIGIDAEHLPHLFDRFYRVDPSRSRRSGGSGLGLAIVRQLVQAHDGEVAVSSRVGVGTTFSVHLPGVAHGNR